jgi:hypothetical protein
MVRFAGVFIEIVVDGPVRRRDVRDGIQAVVQKAPIGFQPGGAGEKASHADNGDRGRMGDFAIVDIHGSIPKNPNGCIGFSAVTNGVSR